MRAARTSRGLTLNEASARTRIRASYLAAFEEERLDALPPYPFVRGFLRTYAVELGLDPEPLLQRLTAIMPEPTPGSIEESTRLDRTIVAGRPLTVAQRVGRSAGIAGLVAGIALVLYFAKQLQEFSQPVPTSTPQSAPSPQAGATSQAAVPTQHAAAAPPSPLPTPQAPSRPSPTSGPTRTPQPSPAPTPSAPAGVTTQITGGGITIDLEATGRSWILVVADDVVVYRAFVTAGEHRRWQANGSMTVRVGNAGFVILTVNGRSIGPLGALGQVVDRTFRKDEIR